MAVEKVFEVQCCWMEHVVGSEKPFVALWSLGVFVEVAVNVN